MFDKLTIYRKIEVDEKIIDERSICNKCRSVDGKGMVYMVNHNGVMIYYNTYSKRMTINGRLANWGEDNSVVSLGDGLYTGSTHRVVRECYRERSKYERSVDLDFDRNGDYIERSLYEEWDEEYEINEDINKIVDDINKAIKDIFKVKVNIRYFRVSYFEAAFNIKTEHVEQYIRTFNRYFQYRKPKSYINYVLEKGLDMASSFYIVPKNNYRRNSKDNYIINFYNKMNQLEHVKRKRKSRIEEIRKGNWYHALSLSRRMRHIYQDDLEEARGVMRLEVQAGSRLIKNLYEKFVIRARDLEAFLDIDICRNIVVDGYRRLIGDEKLDFYSYSATVEIIKSKEMPKKSKQALLDYCKKISQGVRVSSTTRRKHNSILAEWGIFPYFISNKEKVDYLESPIKFLDRYVDDCKEKAFNHVLGEDRLVNSTRYGYKPWPPYDLDDKDELERMIEYYTSREEEEETEGV